MGAPQMGGGPSGRSSRPARVLYVSHTPDFRGSAMSLTQLMTGLDRARFMPVAVFSKDGPLAREMEKCHIPTYVLRKRGFLGTGLVREALSLIGREEIDLVHLNSAVPFSKYVGIAARLKGLPVIWHIREDPNGKRVRRLKKWIRLLANRIFVVSTQLEVALGGAGKTVKIYNGVDTSKFTPEVGGAPFRARLGLSPVHFIFAIVGTIEENKGTLVFLEAAEAVRESAPEVRFVLVGDGLPEDVERVRGFLRERPALAERTVLTGRLANMPEVMAGIDVLVMASLGENFPRVLIEAMASGKPVVATRVGEVFHIVDPGKTGLIVPAGDAAALATAMKQCLDMGESLNALGRAARDKVVHAFTLPRHIEAVQSEYERLLGGRTRS